VDAAGNLYIADEAIVRKVSPDGTITTFAGTGLPGFGGDGGPATAARLGNNIYGIAVDSVGNVYIADSSNNRIRQMTPGGIISTVAGNGTSGFAGDGGPATAARLNFPQSVQADSSGNLYISDGGNNRIRKVAGGTINTIVGTGVAGFNGDGPQATAQQLNLPWGITRAAKDRERSTMPMEASTDPEIRRPRAIPS
jgi:hypothetical protein